MNPRPTRAEVQAARGRTIPDVLSAGLRVLFCGINPSLYSAAIGHHFGRPGNRFWPALYRGGFTPRLFTPYEDVELLPLGMGVTNLVARATATADELDADELRAGAEALEQKLERHRPACLAVLGVGAFRTGFARPRATLGLQGERLGITRVWVLPNPSGLNAHYRLEELGQLFAELNAALGPAQTSPSARNSSSE